jgi:hypothetical protein
LLSLIDSSTAGSFSPSANETTHMFTALVERTVDYEATAALANEAFGFHRFDARSMRWRYERSFSLGATVVALQYNGRKVGQCAMLHQSVLMDGIQAPAVQIVDLFLVRESRSPGAVQILYEEVERQCKAQGIRFALGIPNARALSANERFFKFRPFLWLPIHLGVAMPVRSSALISSIRFDPAAKQEMCGLLASYRSAPNENGVPWDEAGLFQRLSDPRRTYGLHATDDLLLVSSARTSRRVKYTLLCGFFARTGSRSTGRSVRTVVRAACCFWRRPIFAFVGCNNSLAASPGFSLPGWLRRSPMLLQLRDFQPEKSEPRLSRFQSLDFDFG